MYKGNSTLVIAYNNYRLSYNNNSTTKVFSFTALYLVIDLTTLLSTLAPNTNSKRARSNNVSAYAAIPKPLAT